MTGNDNAAPQNGLPRLAASLEQAIIFLSESKDLELLQTQLDTAVREGNPTKATESAQDLAGRLNVIVSLKGTLDKIDPHTIDPKQFQDLKNKKLTELVEDALVEGKYRERRMILQAREAETNQNLAWAAWAAAIAALITAVIGLIGPWIHK